MSFASNPSVKPSAPPSKCIQKPSALGQLWHPALVRATILSSELLAVAPDGLRSSTSVSSQAAFDTAAKVAF